ncbi:MAG: hypothetical protein KKA64_00805 [Nanoarchaeota archaeon]|nr:hypothetical protein [Nanoarchaeota archaeon]
MRNKKNLLVKRKVVSYNLANLHLLVLISLLIVTISFTSAVYSSSSYQYTSPGMNSFDYMQSQGINIAPYMFDKEKCGAGQDFIIQINPTGCQPSVIRSDLLEEQNVPVFCPLMATKMNPLIDVEAIDYMTFPSKNQYPPEVSGIGFHPARAAIRSQQQLLNSPILENIGYAVIVLKQQKNESAMPESVKGNVTAHIRYDIKNAFGVGSASYNLPVLNDEQWNEDYKQYGFWNGKGYLRIEEISENEADIAIYKDKESRISTLKLVKGTTSREVYIPGYYCIAGVQLRLEGLADPDTRARLRVGDDVVEVSKGEKFLENKCQVVDDIKKEGVNQKVTISCNTEDGVNRFSLEIKPKIRLNVDEAFLDLKIGEKVFESADGKGGVYLAGGYFSGKNQNEKDLVVYLLKKSSNEATLSENEISMLSDSAKKIKENKEKNSQKEFKIGDTTYKAEDIVFITPTGTQVDFAGGKIKLLGFAGGVDREFQNTETTLTTNTEAEKTAAQNLKLLKEAFETSKEEYEKVINNLPNEKVDEAQTESAGNTYAEHSLYELIMLSKELEQKSLMIDLANRFIESYPDSSSIKKVSDLLSGYRTSNSEIDSNNVFITGKSYGISFEDIVEPGFDDYGVSVSVSGKNGDVQTENLEKGKEYKLFGTNNFIMLKEIKDNSATISHNIVTAKKDNANGNTETTNDLTIKLNELKTAGEYTIKVTGIKIKKLAKISLIPMVNNAGTDANFSFDIRIEKRAIQLSPEKIKERISTLNKTIAKWDSLSEKLGKTVEGFKAACLATSAVLTVKNLVQNTGGKSIARKQVMEHYRDVCQKELAKTPSQSMDECYLKYSSNIDTAVNQVYTKMKTQEEEIKVLQHDYTTKDILGESVNDEKLLKDYAPVVLEGLSSSLGDTFVDPLKIGESIKIADLTSDVLQKHSTVYQLRDIELATRIIKDTSINEDVKKSYEKKLYSILDDIDQASQASRDKTTLATKYSIDSSKVLIGSTTKMTEFPYTETKFSDIIGVSGETIDKNTFVQLYEDQKDSQDYLLVLNDNYVVTQTYKINNKVLVKENAVNPLKLAFKKFDSKSYQNKFISSAGYGWPAVRYYETGQDKGLPALVPFDLDNGWYAATKQTLPVLGQIKAYESSGRVSSLYLCNVGSNGIEQFSSGIGDDICEGINLGTGQSYNQFYGLSKEETSKRINEAVDAIEQASRQYKKGVKEVRIGKYTIKVGNPATNVPELECQEFMSPKDCHILFNVCDPVVCPSSRCNLGGNYAVDDVVQSGIIGSIALCLPNFKGFGGDVYVPVCLSGLKAGIDSFLGAIKDYQKCLQHSLDTGEQIGICDEVHSIYMCEFFWRQMAPLANLVIPKVAGAIMGQNVQGGGEYLGVMSAWENAQSSMTYFTQYYAANSYKAFKARTSDEVGSAVCKNFISAKYPEGKGILDALIEPDSPVQYSSWFHEIPFTSATVPPISQYKVFYYIFAGKDEGAYYRVYLKNPEGSSFYESNPTISVATGYIGEGETATETKDFTATSGYKQLCIMVNTQEENCDFKQVSTSFALDYVSDKYVQEQAGKTDIKTERECVSGSPSLYSFATPNVQEGAQEAVSPALYNRGITRVCATDSPGGGTDVLDGANGSRWVEVGYCGDTKMKCWLDENTVKAAIDIKSIEKDVLSKTSEDYMKTLEGEGNYLNDNQYEDFKKSLTDSLGKVGDEVKVDNTKTAPVIQDVITKIDNSYNRVFYTNQRAVLIYFRARAYNLLARIYSKETPVKEPPVGGNTNSTDDTKTG